MAIIGGSSPGARNPNLMSCPSCQGMVSKQARACPHCGHLINATAGVGAIVWKVFFLLFVIGGGYAILMHIVENCG